MESLVKHSTDKVRIYPTPAQKKQLAIEFGHTRNTWNWALETRSNTWKEHKQSLGFKDLCKLLILRKQNPEFSWLQDASTCCLQQVLRDQEKAFRRFFDKEARYPRTKKKTGRQSVRYTLNRRSSTPFIPGKLLKLPKLGVIDVNWTRLPGERPKMATIVLKSPAVSTMPVLPRKR